MRKPFVAILVMLLFGSLVAPTTASAADDDRPQPPPSQAGPGFTIVTVNADELATELELAPRSRRAMADEVRVLAISTLRGVRDSGLPEWAQWEELADAGYGSWAEVPDSKLDEPIAPININLDMAMDITPEVEEIQAGGPYPSPRGVCTRWKSGTVSVDDSIDLRRVTDIAIPDLPDDFEGSVDVDVGGELEIVGSVSYRYKTVREICSIAAGIYTLGPGGVLAGYLAAQIPYKWEVTDSNLTGRLQIDGTLGVGAELAYTYRDQLWSKNIDLKEETISLPIFEVMSLEIDLDLDLEFALTFEARIGVTGASEFDQEWRVSGSADISWRCLGTECETVSNDTDLNFSNNGPIRSQRSFDMKLIPSADLNLDLDVDVAVAGTKFFDLAAGTFGIVAQLPARYFWTDGNDCSDADGDGEFERVQTQLVDLNFELFGYVRGSLFDAGYGQFLPFDLPFFKEKREKPLWKFNVVVPMYEKNIYFRDLSPADVDTALQPVLGRVGSFVDDRGVTRTGVEIVGTRQCYPLTAAPTYQIDWGDGSAYTTSSGGFVAHNFGTGDNQNVRVRLSHDDAGRRFRPGGWVSKSGVSGLQRPSTPPNVRASVYSSTSGEIQWDAASDDIGVIGYRVIRNGRDLGFTEGRSWYEPNLATGVYDYQIYARDGQGGQSAIPARVRLDLTSHGQPEPDPSPDPVPDPDPAPDPDPVSSGSAPSAPPGLRASRYSSTSGEIMWNPSSDGDGLVVGYRVVRNGTGLGIVDARSRYESGLSTGSYRYEVYAVDDDGNESAPSTVTLNL